MLNVISIIVHKRVIKMSPRFILSNEHDLPEIECNYYLPNELRVTLSQYNIEYFSLLGFNIRSIRRNFSSFLAFLNCLNFNFKFIYLIETWLTESIDYSFNLVNYNTVNVYRSNHSGGIKIYYRNDITIQLIENLTYVIDEMDIISFKITENNFSYIICVI